MADPSKPSWRRGAPRGRRPGTGGPPRFWLTRREDRAAGERIRHRARLIVLGLLGLAMLLVFLAAVFWHYWRTPVLAVGVAEYPDVRSPLASDARLPPNAFVEEDVRRLESRNLEVHRFPAPLVTNENLLEFVRRKIEERPAWRSRKVLLIYLSAHGAVREDGTPCLLLSKANPLDSTTWLPVDTLLEALGREPNTKKVLILDCLKMESNWSLGLLDNGFAERMAGRVKPGSGVYVLLPCGRGQRAWSAPELHGSVFGYFLAQGLREAGKGNRVTLLDLYEYLQRNVCRYARNYRAALQQPQLIPEVARKDDFLVAYRDPAAAGRLRQWLQRTHEERRAAAEKQGGAVQALWENYQQLAERGGLERGDPVGLAEAQQQLLRVEQLVLAGQAYAAEFEQARSSAGALLKRLELAAATPGKLRGFSLPLAMQLENVPEGPSEREAWIGRWAKAGGWPKNEKGEPEKLAASYLAAADVAWRWLLQRDAVTARGLGESLQFVDGTARSGPDLVEVHFLRLLHAHLDRPAPGGEFDYATQQAARWSLAARGLAEVAASPQDERTHYWAQGLVDGGDELRRLAEDQLFVGQEPEKAGRVFQELLAPQGPYARAAAQQAAIATRYQARDQAWAQLPYLAQWLVDYQRLREPLHMDAAFEPLARELDQLVTETGRLAAELDAAPPGGSAALAPGAALEESSRRVDQARRALLDAFHAYCGNLVDVKAASNVLTLRAAEAVLHTPLIPAKARGRLFRDKYLATMFSFPSPWDPGADKPLDAQELAKEQQQLDAHWQWLGQWERHPALGILDRADLQLPEDLREPELKRPDSPRDWLLAQGERVRARLSQVHDIAKRLDRDGRGFLQKNPGASDRAKRLELSKADRLTRAACVLLGRRPWQEPQEDPSRRLQALDRHFLFLWHCRRTLDDLYGPSPKRPGPPYFEEVARAYLASAQSAFETKVYVHDSQDLEQLLGERLAAVRSLAIKADNLSTLDKKTAAEHRAVLYWKGLPEKAELAVFLERLPGSGVAELQPVTDSATGKQVRRRGFPAGQPAPVPIAHRIPLDQLGDAASSSWDVALLFRGHAIKSPFALRFPRLETVSYVIPEVREDASVVVRGEGGRRGHIMFILDCSGSMTARMPDGSDRMASAKRSLREVLQALLREGDCWVGLSAYGHRNRFVRHGSEVVQSPRVPEAPHPDEDVQEVIGFGRLDPAHYATIDKAIGSPLLSPWGQTPLYLALCRALSGIPRGPDDEPKHIILLTDGVNDQYDTSRRAYTYADVLNLYRQLQGEGVKNLRIDVVLIDEQAARQGGVEDAEQQIANLKALATQETGGTYVDARNTEQLIDALRKALDLYQYSVTAPGQAVQEKDRRDLNAEWKESPFTAWKPGYRVVRVHGGDPEPSCPIVLEGGESLQLRYLDRDNRLEFLDFARKYEERVRDHPDEPIEDPLDRGRRYAINALRPEVRRDRDGTFFADFFVAVQNADLARFTPRPKQVWAEILPLDRTDAPVADQPFHCFDLDFEADDPVPVLRFRVRGWPDPSVARRAEISVWLKFKEEPPAAREKIDASGARKTFARVPGLPGVTFEASGEIPAGRDGYLVLVEQRHTDRDSMRYLASVRCLQLARRITRKTYYFEDRLTIRHEFELPDKQAAEIWITPRDAITREAISVKRLRLDVRY